MDLSMLCEISKRVKESDDITKDLRDSKMAIESVKEITKVEDIDILLREIAKPFRIERAKKISAASLSSGISRTKTYFNNDNVGDFV